MARAVFLSFVVFFSVLYPAFGQRIFQLTDSLSGNITLATMSGDGSSIFYAVQKGEPLPPLVGKSRLYMRRLDSVTPEVLTEEQHIRWIMANRDGSKVIFWVDDWEGPPGNVRERAGLYSVDVPTKKVIHIAPQLEVHPEVVALAEEARKVIVGAGRGIGTVSWDRADFKWVKIFTENIGIEAFAADPRGEIVHYFADTFPRQSEKKIRRLDLRSGEIVEVFSLTDCHQIVGLFVAPDEREMFVRCWSPGTNSVFRYTTGRGVQPLFQGTNTILLSVSWEAKRLLIESDANLTGENPDRYSELFVVSTDGGQARQITRSGEGREVGLSGLLTRKSRISDDGSLVEIVTSSRLPRLAQSFGSWLYQIAPTSGEARLLAFEGVQRHDFPLTLSDNSHLAFLSSLVATDGPQFFLTRTDGSHVRQLTRLELGNILLATSSADAEVLAWLEEEKIDLFRGTQRILAYDTRNERQLEIAQFRLDQVELIGEGPVEALALDPRGRKLLFSTRRKVRDGDPNANAYLYRADLEKNPPEIEFLASGFSPALSGDGQWIAYHSPAAGDASKVFLMRSDGTGQREVGKGFRPKLNADGTWITFLRFIARPGSIVQLSNSATASDSSPQKIPPRFPPELVRGEIVVARSDGTVTKELAAVEKVGLPFSSVQISADGKTIVGLAGIEANTNLIAAFSQDGRQTAAIALPVPAYISNSSWSISPDASRVHFATDAKIVSNQDGSEEIFAASLGPFQSWIPAVKEGNRLFTGIALTNTANTAWKFSIVAHDANGSAPGSVPRVFNGLLDPGEQFTRLLSDVFGRGITGQTVSLAISSPERLNSFVALASATLEKMEGTAASETLSSNWLFPLSRIPFARSEPSSALVIFNPHPEPVLLEMRMENPIFPRIKRFQVPSLGTLQLDVMAEFLAPAGFVNVKSGLLSVSTNLPIRAELRLESSSGSSISSLIIPALESAMTSDLLIFPHVFKGGSLRTWLWVVNPFQRAEIEVQFLDGQGRSLLGPQGQHYTVAQQGMLDISIEEMLAQSPPTSGHLQVRTLTAGARIGGILIVADGENHGRLFSVAPFRSASRRALFPFLIQQSNLFTGYALINRYEFPVRYTIDVFDAKGSRQASATRWLGARSKESALLSDLLPQEQTGGYFTVTSDWPVSALSLLGTSSSWANIPAQ